METNAKEGQGGTRPGNDWGLAFDGVAAAVALRAPPVQRELRTHNAGDGGTKSRREENPRVRDRDWRAESKSR
ncbi:uncharacterized protein ColSpa_00984 [Colletotrichum spaethianum]|uniref:Uncharacterized protein n=1 Tax=Colletotrichum spaethianum TaxID=700344 RepID=A0AA37L705_9PEZI|nr:uncharacterized protein ColSpa_00984 [Colletotrichum spaethianum]GKT40803.1 hypothetical protein ColSpa_00984 [Colletotrichum spaethianum]